MTIHVYIISLQRDNERRNKIAKDFNEQQIDFQFFDAVDAKDTANSKLIESMRNNGVGCEMTDGEIACTLSHQHLYQYIISNQQEWVIILEDDVIIDSKFKDFVSSLSSSELTKLKKDNLYLLGGQKGLHDYPVLGLSLFGQQKVAGRKFRRVNYNAHKLRRTCSYLMNDAMAKNLIELTSSYGTYRADSWKLMHQKNVIKDFFLNEIILHPKLNQFNSHLEQERQLKAEVKKKRSRLGKMLKIIRSWIKVCYFSLFK
ncbi:glycosyltransferase family 25 protein [uncultured Leclercia sp.]|uniref:glycosyltransferase family 25 protein n=1 Tax=uncultured Leclercia sp. TaxID=332959 RepID=UPI00062C2572|nr:glycosyltransferase family 25 protein [uncultured Leclercia sp.]KKY84330.1 beta-1,4-galactosyltransferase [Enterobacter cloacae]